jgi:tungsten cofactor oxidoreducase radical SAM maturase
MPKVKTTNGNELALPGDFLWRRHLHEKMEYWLDERNGDLLLHPILPNVKKLYIEVTTRCNLRCRTCIRNIWDDPLEDMSSQTFQRSLDGLKDLPGLERVIFTSFGEPLIHPNILDMVEAVRKYDLAVTIGTNGLLLSPKVIREIVRLGVDRVIISIDGGKPETFAMVRGALLSRVIANIERLNHIKNELGSLNPAVGVEFVALRSNISELDELVSLSSKLGISRLIVSNVLPYTEEMLSEVLYGYKPVPPLKAHSWALSAGAWVLLAVQELPRMHWGAERLCRFIQNHAIVVGWDGNVSPCYALSHNYSYYAIDGKKKRVNRYVLGNVNQRPLTEIWMSEEYVRFRSEVMAYHFPSCPDCDLRETCDLRAQNKGCWGWQPSCADCLWAQDIIRCP